MGEVKGMTERLADFIVGTKSESISPEILEHAKVAFLDFLAVTYGGLNDPLVKILLDYSEIMGGNKDATIIGLNEKRSMSHAALINGAASHALDYDDTLVSFLGHPSVTLFPALLALSQKKGKSGREFLDAYLIGLQTGGTIGACAGLDHYLGGWHATATLGHLAAAAACARLLNLDKEKTLYALGLAATQSSGLKRNFGTMAKPFHAGMAAQSGLDSALLAEMGFTAAKDVLEGPQGFFEALRGKVNEDILSMLGLGWDVVNLSQKYHASCHATHSPLECAREIVKTGNIDVENIEKILVKISSVSMQAASNTEPVSGTEAKFSIPFCIANALYNDVTGMGAFTAEKVSDPKIRALMEKIDLELDPEKTALEATVIISVAGGKEFSGFSDILQNIPELEKKKTGVSAKFMDLAGLRLGQEKAESLSGEISSLETITDMSAFAEKL